MSANADEVAAASRTYLHLVSPFREEDHGEAGDKGALGIQAASPLFILVFPQDHNAEKG